MAFASLAHEFTLKDDILQFLQNWNTAKNAVITVFRKSQTKSKRIIQASK